MKRIVSLFLLFLLIPAFTGCEKEKALKDLVIGKWEIKSQTLIFYKNGVKLEEVTENFQPNEQWIEILSDGTGNHYTDGEIDDPFTWTLNGTMMTVVLTLETMEVEVTVDGDTMTYKLSRTEIDGVDTYKTDMISVAKRIS